jgi:hypothetical protein
VVRIEAIVDQAESKLCIRTTAAKGAVIFGLPP